MRAHGKTPSLLSFFLLTPPILTRIRVETVCFGSLRAKSEIVILVASGLA